MSDTVTTIAALEDCIGKTPPPMHLKVIDHLDEAALRWIAKSPLMFAVAGDGAAVAVTMGGGQAGFTQGDTAELRLDPAMLDDPAAIRPGVGFGSLFLLPGIGETLRVNGKVVDANEDEIRIAVEECYGHCAKALIRSDFWAAAPVERQPVDAASFAAASRFMALATIDTNGHADLSPKGDPAGTMTRIQDGKLWFAERPGNRRADSLRNIIGQPRIGGILLVPGSTQVVRFSGAAQVNANEQARAAFAVGGKTPTVVTVVTDLSIELVESAALKRANLWPVERPTEGIDAPKMFLDHVKLNRDKGLGAKLASTLLSMPGMQGLMRKGLEKDYKDNLY
jgi:uncharacterized protein